MINDCTLGAIVCGLAFVGVVRWWSAIVGVLFPLLCNFGNYMTIDKSHHPLICTYTGVGSRGVPDAGASPSPIILNG